MLHLENVLFRAEVDDTTGLRVIRLAGRLQGDVSVDLARLCDDSPKPLRLDLSELVSADGPGLGTLVMLRRRGAELVNATPYLALQLEGELARRVE